MSDGSSRGKVEEAMTTVYLIRHAESVGNITQVFQGQHDFDITERGEAQLECLKNRFKNIEFDAVYSSPLIRAKKTAESVNFYRHAPVIYCDDLKEINAGKFENVKWTDLPSLYPEQYEMWNKKLHLFAPPGGERMCELYERIVKAVTRIVAENQDKTVVIVTHGCSVRNYMCYAHGWEFSELDNMKWFENTGVAKLEYDITEKPRIIYENDASHLTPELSTLAHANWMDSGKK